MEGGMGVGMGGERGGLWCIFRRGSDDGWMIWQSRRRALEMERIQTVSGCLHAGFGSQGFGSFLEGRTPIL